MRKRVKHIFTVFFVPGSVRSSGSEHGGPAGIAHGNRGKDIAEDDALGGQGIQVGSAEHIRGVVGAQVRTKIVGN